LFCPWVDIAEVDRLRQDAKGFFYILVRCRYAHSKSTISRLIFAINVTLDGCCDHTEVIADDELHQFYATGSQAEGDFARTITKRPKYVFSHTLKQVEWKNSFLMKGPPADEVSKLKQKHQKDLVVLASPGFAATLSRLGLIDEYQLLMQPIMAGHGPTLFQDVGGSRNLKLIASKKFNSVSYCSSMGRRKTGIHKAATPYHALQRTRPSRPGCKRTSSWAGSLSLGR
jgi:dihydrofolate reductase